MKVLLLAENWPPRVGGIERYLTGIAKSLPRGSVTVTVPREADDSVDGLTVRRRRFFWPIVRPRWLPLYVRLLTEVRREKFDVVLCGKALFEGLPARWLGRQTGIPYIIFTYGTEVETWARQPRERRKLAAVLQSARYVTYINPETKRSLTELGARDDQLVEVWPGVDERFFAQAGEEAVAQVLHTHRITRPYIVSVARLIPRKGLDTLIEAFSQLDQTRFGKVTLVIAGDGPEKENLQHLARQLFVESSVVFTGRVEEDELPLLYQGAELFALTPRHLTGDLEGFGIVFLEAAASNKAAVATATGGVTGAVIDGETGLVVPPDSPGEVKAALEKLLGERDLQQRLATAARRRARNEFSWEKRVAPIKELIDKAGDRTV